MDGWMMVGWEGLDRLLLMPSIALLRLHLLHSALEIVCRKVRGLHSWDEERSVREEVIHLLERALGGLGEDGPEEEGVCKVADLRSCK